jgi:hypothetical protein
MRQNHAMKHAAPVVVTGLVVAGFILDGGSELERDLDWLSVAYLVICPFTGYFSGLLTLRLMPSWSPFRRPDIPEQHAALPQHEQEQEPTRSAG